MKEKTATPAKLRTRRGIGETQRTPVKADPSGIRLHDVCQTLEEYRFAGAAGTKHRKDTAARHVESDARQDDMVIEAFVQVFDVKQKILSDGIRNHTRNEVIT